MTVRAKLEMTERHDKGYTNILLFETRYDDSIPEDVRFETATPTGKFEMQCNNPKALAQFEVGKSYYVDFNPVPEE